MASSTNDRLRLLELCCSLAAKNGMTLGTLDRDALALLMLACAQTVDPARRFTESQFNQHLSAWLAAEGSMLRTDHAELRRTLVDLQFFVRDGFGRVYQRAPGWPVALADVGAAVEATDLGRLLREARTKAAARRDARKREALMRMAPR
jgi:Uncharacterized protein conserved in bacteria (DUF2087)